MIGSLVLATVASVVLPPEMQPTERIKPGMAFRDVLKEFGEPGDAERNLSSIGRDMWWNCPRYHIWVFITGPDGVVLSVMVHSPPKRDEKQP
jgi:hypothetical protein